jgi:multidrug efflux pump subunit AcrB
MLAAAIAGLWAYGKLGREEDPPFTIKTMVVKTVWPGATATDTLQQVTDRIEKKLEELPFLDFVRSYTKPGESVVFVNLKDTVGGAAAVQPLWYQVRKKIDDIRQTLPSGVVGPFFNDEFGDTYSLIFALTSDGFTHRELRDVADRLRPEILRVRDIAKVDLVGVQDEKVYLEFSTQQVAALGLEPNALMQALQAQNALVPSGTVEAGPERIAVRVSGEFTSEGSLKEVNFRFNDRFFRLGDIATIKRAYVDPAQPMFRYNGQPAIGLAISMTAGGDVLALGHNVKERVAELARELPVGVDLHLVADQPEVVHEAVGEFTKSLMEAIAIVLAVSFLTLGWRPGIVVAIAIPLVLAITFVLMKFTGISLQRISLGALIIALVPGRRRHDRGRDDDHQDGGRLRQDQSRDLRLYVDGVPDADRDLGDDRRLRAGRLCAKRRRRILLLAVRRRQHRPPRVLGRGGAVHAAHRRRHPARQDQGPY